VSTIFVVVISSIFCIFVVVADVAGRNGKRCNAKIVSPKPRTLLEDQYKRIMELEEALVSIHQQHTQELDRSKRMLISAQVLGLFAMTEFLNDRRCR